jgi:excisionase family DNA binding protein
MSKSKKAYAEAVQAGIRPLLISVPDAASYLGIGLTLMNELVKAHAIPKIQLGSRRLLRMEDVERLAKGEGRSK